MTSSIQSDVIIVGCGPVGVVAAHLLGKAGISTLVIERDREPHDLPRAVHLDHEIMRIFQSVGLAERLLPQLTMPAGAMHFGADRGVIRQFQAMVTTDRLGWGSDYFFYQPDLERALRAALVGHGTVQRLMGHEVLSVEQDEYSVTVVAHGDHGPVTATARYALACDGGRSKVRQCVGIALNDLGFDEPWIVVDAMVHTPIVMPSLIGAPAGVAAGNSCCFPEKPLRTLPIPERWLHCSRRGWAANLTNSYGARCTDFTPFLPSAGSPTGSS